MLYSYTEIVYIQYTAMSQNLERGAYELIPRIQYSNLFTPYQFHQQNVNNYPDTWEQHGKNRLVDIIISNYLKKINRVPFADNEL